MNLSQWIPSIRNFGPTVIDTDVSTSPTIFARFTTEIDSTKIDSDLKLSRYVFLLDEASGVTVPLSFVSYTDLVLTFAPSGSLTSGATYIVTVLGTIASPAGRQMGTDRHWSFKVAASAVGTPILLEPANLTALNVTPVLSWEAVSVDSGTVHYRVELDDDVNFNSIDSHGWSTSTTQTSALPALTLNPSTTYFWRVTAQVTPVTGAVLWGAPSETFAFYVGTFADASPGTTTTYQPPALFRVLAVSPEDAATNLSDWPPIQVTYNGTIDLGDAVASPGNMASAGVVIDDLGNPVESFGPVDIANLSEFVPTIGTVLLRRESVDGQPGTVGANVTATVTASGNVLTLVPEGPIFPNSRYTLRVSGVTDTTGHLAPTFESYFTGPYHPLYVGAIVLRANYARLLTDVTDDFLNFHIFRTSLDVNRFYIRRYNYNTYFPGPTETVVRNNTFPLTYAMERWTEIESGRRILQTIYNDRVLKAGQQQRLGEYEIQTDTRLLSTLQEEIKRLHSEALFWVGEFSRKHARIETGRKGEFYPEQRLQYDWGYQDTMRTRI